MAGMRKMQNFWRDDRLRLWKNSNSYRGYPNPRLTHLVYEANRDKIHTALGEGDGDGAVRGVYSGELFRVKGEALLEPLPGARGARQQTMSR